MKNNLKNFKPIKFDTSILIIKIPCIIFPNFKKSKKEIYNICKNRSGIYCLKNIENKKIYIGQSINLKQRLAYYYNLKKEYLKGKSKIYDAVLKQNLNNFSLLILDFCYKNHLNKKENYYIKELKPEYNILQQANSRKWMSVSDETKLKFSLKLKGRILIPLTKITIVENIITKEKIEYNSITEAAKKLKASRNTLVKYKGKVFRDRFLITIIERKI